MPAFTLYGARGSSNADRVRFVLAEGGITDWDHVLLNFGQREHKVNTKIKNVFKRHWSKLTLIAPLGS